MYIHVSLTAAESESSAHTYHYVPALEEYYKDEDFMGKYLHNAYAVLYLWDYTYVAVVLARCTCIRVCV